MKKMISLLSVALLALTFAAGCGKLAKCSDAKVEADCKDSKKFEQKDGKDQSCKWTADAADKTKGTCADAGTPPAAWTAAATSAAECNQTSATDATTCSALDATLTAKATDKCVWDATAAVKCAPAKK